MNIDFNRDEAGGGMRPRAIGSNFGGRDDLKFHFPAPEVNVHIVESNDDIGGIGEPGIMPLAPAVANAVFNATGGRLRRMPFTPERVLAAIKAA